MKKKFLFLCVALLMCTTTFAEVYQSNLVLFDQEIDYFNISNNTGENITIKFECGKLCDVVSVNNESNAKIKLGYDFDENDTAMLFQIRFEVKTEVGEEKKVHWSIDTKNHNINLFLKKDEGWNF